VLGPFQLTVWGENWASEYQQAGAGSARPLVFAVSGTDIGWYFSGCWKPLALAPTPSAFLPTLANRRHLFCPKCLCGACLPKFWSLHLTHKMTLFKTYDAREIRPGRSIARSILHAQLHPTPPTLTTTFRYSAWQGEGKPSALRPNVLRKVLQPGSPQRGKAEAKPVAVQVHSRIRFYGVCMGPQHRCAQLRKEITSEVLSYGTCAENVDARGIPAFAPQQSANSGQAGKRRAAIGQRGPYPRLGEILPHNNFSHLAH